jgi:hypothetical protein
MNYKQKKLCFYCKRFNHRQDECCTRIQDNKPCTDGRGRKYWPKRYTDEETTQGTNYQISALTSYVTPLRGSRAVLLQLIFNLCLASLTTCNKLYEIFEPGEKILPRINVKTGNQTTSWLFDTGAAITCMNSRSFNATFGNQKPKKNLQCSKLCCSFWGRNELHRGLRSGPVDQRTKTPGERDHQIERQHHWHRLYAPQQSTMSIPDR